MMPNDAAHHFHPRKLLTAVLLGVGLLLLASPFLMRWWISGDYDRYLGIISGPWPYSHLGSGPLQLFVYGFLIVAGLVIVVFALVLKRFLAH
jgi:hypothetical protein